MSVHDEIIGIADNNSQATLNARKRDGVLGESSNATIYRQGFEAGRQHGKNEAANQCEPPIETETFENPQTKKLDSFQQGYNAGYTDGRVDAGRSIEATEACAKIFNCAMESGMSLAVAYDMARTCALHYDGEV